MYPTGNFWNLSFLGNTVSNFTWFLGILLLGFIFKRVVSKVLNRLIFRFFKKFAAEVKADKFVELLLRPMELLLLSITLYFSINMLDYPLNKILFKKSILVDGKQIVDQTLVIDLIDLFFEGLIIILFTWVVLRVIDFVCFVLLHKAIADPTNHGEQIIPFIKDSVKLITVFISILLIFGAVFKFDIATLVAGLGIGGLAVALAAKESLENLLGSFTIFLDKPFAVGDLVKVDGIEGAVEKVGFRSTRIRTAENSLITLPNKKMVDSALDNLSLREFRRVKFSVEVGLETSSDDLKKVIIAIENYLNSNLETTNPENIVMLDGFKESSFSIMINYFVKMMDYNLYLKTKERVNFEILKIFKDNDLTFAMPTRTIYHINNQNADDNREEATI